MAAAREYAVGILRVYEWSAPTVSFGRHERTVGIYSPESLANAGLSAVRRPTGGRALLHSRELTYSVSLPIPDETPWATAYDCVNERLLCAMLAMGIPARIVGRSIKPREPDALSPDSSGLGTETIDTDVIDTDVPEP
ncbi:MAG: hypothetical protein ABI120_22635, partial [Gemmatimonadaceae bacterium]